MNSRAENLRELRSWVNRWPRADDVPFGPCIGHCGQTTDCPRGGLCSDCVAKS